MAALQRANFVRFSRVELKKAVKSGEVMVAEVLLGDVPDWLETIRVEELCNAIPRFGWRHFQRVMQRTHTKLSATVGDLTQRKQVVLGEALAEWEGEAQVRRARQRRLHGVGARAKAGAG